MFFILVLIHQQFYTRIYICYQKWKQLRCNDTVFIRDARSYLCDELGEGSNQYIRHRLLSEMCATLSISLHSSVLQGPCGLLYCNCQVNMGRWAWVTFCQSLACSTLLPASPV